MSVSQQDQTTTEMVRCSHCGHMIPRSISEDAERLLSNLRSQNDYLNNKAAEAISQLANYELEVQRLRTQLAELSHREPEDPPLPPLEPTIEPRSPQRRIIAIDPPQRPASVTRLASLASMIPGRKKATLEMNSHPNHSDPALSTLPTDTTSRTVSSPHLLLAQPTSIPPLTLISLQSTLETERDLRLKAESNLTQAQTELEELTAQLFGQANEMVATERKARAKLEERVKQLENRDGEKRKRLDRLEGAMARIERVRALCEPAPAYEEFQPKRGDLSVQNPEIKVS